MFILLIWDTCYAIIQEEKEVLQSIYGADDAFKALSETSSSIDLE